MTVPSVSRYRPLGHEDGVDSENLNAQAGQMLCAPTKSEKTTFMRSANVTLLGDNVIQAEVAIRHSKAAGGIFRAIAQPDVQWKLQQLQDLGNHIARASKLLFEADLRIFGQCHSDQFTQESGELVLSASKAVRTEICAARNAIVLPRRK
ncbi:hypothetical protein KIN20_023340 [Parelaphostrongylus tenuis]|uniref:Uncharacterized protein n=1 Tax=Parelaphostrongylus tenuis TaxID=148309 RepID=A0AAD5MRW2_PARTN|nr:hypothetical protein KIN20_023340 [Parelaphostrongylus tenuis]